jgi:arylsulfatase A-like enzyme
MLRTHGYRTAAIGKWHLGLNVRNLDGEFVRATPGEILDSVDWTAPVEGGPLDYGFDYYYGDPGGPQVKAFVENRHYDMTPISKRGGKVFKSPNWNVRSQDVTHLNKSLEFIEDHHTANQINGDETPFFLYFAAVSPHEPAQPPVTVNGVPVQGVSSAGQRGDEVLAFDVMLGQIWDKLDELGITDNTLIIATSDNGPLIGNDEQYDHMSTGGLRGKKWNLWEGGHRVPFIARWGDGTHEGSMIPPGLVSDEIIGLHDLMATAADLVGATLPSDAAEDSESILPALFGEQFDGTIRSPIIHQKADKNRTFAVRDKEWKLILGDDQSTRLVETGQLYNLVDDLLETNNLYYQRSDVVTHLTGILTHYQRTGRSARRFATAPAPTAVEAGLVLLSLLLLHCAVTRIKRHWQGCVGRTALRLRKSPGTKWTI